jgi:hypothetical protein
LLAWVGSHADSYEQARWFGDDISVRSDVFTSDLAGVNKARIAMRNFGTGEPPLQRVRTVLEFLVSGREAMETVHGTHCLIAGDLATRLGLGGKVRDALLQMFERWDGRGISRAAAKDSPDAPHNIFQKMNVASRVALAHAVERADRAGSSRQP